ncbi:MAG: radical SAM protein [Acutalibacteraceae bacterium]|nr:radical SAM protein [Acutalibacteraceae bacterium]
MKHSNVAIFVPHNGCPNCCSFCNQVKITGKQNQPTENDVINAVEIAMHSKGYSPQMSEIAFFGGSFTAIERKYMLQLLSTAYSFVKAGKFVGIRISTRPDFIDDEILTILKQYGVTAIELGAQSMCDEVLTLNHRGHTAQQVVNASILIKKFGFNLGLQMMTGLYGSTLEKDIYTAQQICALKPATVRIYPTIIMKNTLLADYYNSGKYITYSLEETISLCATLLMMFEENNIKVIRLGLHSTDELAASMVAGPWHPSIGELCASRIYRNKIENYIKENSLPKGSYSIYINPKEISKLLGQKRSNLEYFKQLGYNIKPIQAQIEKGEFTISSEQ